MAWHHFVPRQFSFSYIFEGSWNGCIDFVHVRSQTAHSQDASLSQASNYCSNPKLGVGAAAAWCRQVTTTLQARWAELTTSLLLGFFFPYLANGDLLTVAVLTSFLGLENFSCDQHVQFSNEKQGSYDASLCCQGLISTPAHGLFHHQCVWGLMYSKLGQG